MSSASSVYAASVASHSTATPLMPGAPTVHNTPSSATSFGATLENLRFLLQKRAQTFEYLRRSHEGKVHWFNTVLFQRSELDAAFDNGKMAKRTVRFAILGMSMSVLLEITAAHDFLRGLLSLLQEFDTIDDENLRARTKNLFKAGKGKRPSGTSDYALNVQDSGDLSYFFSPNIPFDLDYFQVFYTLCDILGEIYSKILSFLGPPSGTASTQASFPGFTQSSNPALNLNPASQTIQPDRRSGVGLSPMLVEVVLKIDSKLKKIIALVTKELDALARTAIKNELSYIGDICLGASDGGGAF